MPRGATAVASRGPGAPSAPKAKPRPPPRPPARAPARGATQLGRAVGSDAKPASSVHRRPALDSDSSEDDVGSVTGLVTGQATAHSASAAAGASGLSVPLVLRSVLELSRRTKLLMMSLAAAASGIAVTLVRKPSEMGAALVKVGCIELDQLQSFKTETRSEKMCYGADSPLSGSLVFSGEHCGDRRIQWMRVYNPLPRTGLNKAKQCTWVRSDDESWNRQVVGSCGVAPSQAPHLPTKLCNQPPEPVECAIKAYMYDLPWPYDDLKAYPEEGEDDLGWPMTAESDRKRVTTEAKKPSVARDGPTTAIYSYGPVNKNETGVTRQASSNILGNLVYYRMQHSECRTQDPDEADVFVVPLFMAKKEHNEWVTKCQEFSHLDGPKKLLELLTHLTPENARKHIMVNVKNMKDCKGWWADPMLPEFVPFTRLAVRYCYHPICDGLTMPDPVHGNGAIFPVPYPSFVHWSRAFSGEPPWVKKRERPNLMSLIMSARTQRNPNFFQRAMVLRDKLWEVCQKYGAPTCLNGSPKQMVSIPGEVYEIYRQSDFCLQPQGDTCERKGILDSMLVGCIPVLFTEEACPMHKLWELHWSEWQKDSVVIFELEEVVSGEVDIKETLEAISPKRRQQMRDTIKARGHTMQYSYDDPPPDMPDALQVIFQAVKDSVDPPIPPMYTTTTHTTTENRRRRSDGKPPPEREHRRRYGTAR